MWNRKSYVGKKHSKEFVEYIREVNKASSDKLTVEDVAYIKQKLAEGIKQSVLSKEYNISISTVNKIAKCKNWTWVKPKLNEKIKYLENNKKERRNYQIKKLYSEGITMKDIAKELNCCINTIQVQTKDLSEKNKKEKKDIINNVIYDFKNGMSKKDIMNKYGISNTTYIRYTSEAYNERKQETIKKVIEMRKSGMMVKDIAEKLHLS